jgi:hypothetical protein
MNDGTKRRGIAGHLAGEKAFLLAVVAEAGEQEGGEKGKRLTISQFFNNKHLAE